MNKQFKSCSCNKADNQKCIITGFRFLYRGHSRAGDLFMCKNHSTLSIHGISDGLMEAREGMSTFEGELVCENEHCGESATGGTIILNEADQAYIAKYNDLSEYEVFP